MGARPVLLITIDTEGDAMWSRPRQITTHNADFLPRFQRLCERFGFKPTYLTNYEMAESAVFQRFGRALIRDATAEIGMHLHAWNSPPLYDLTGDDFYHQPFLVEYPNDVVESKVAYMTHMLQERFDTPIRVHRAGRWATDAHYLALLPQYGYQVDCSVTPTVSWSAAVGDPRGRGGTDYRRYPNQAYFIDLKAPDRPGTSPLLEIPVTIDTCYPWLQPLLRTPLAGVAPLARVAARRHWLRPSGRNLPHLLSLVRRHVRQRSAYLEFVLHSSELMPGGSPVFPTADSIEHLYADLEVLFAAIAPHFAGATLCDYAHGVRIGNYPALGANRA